MFRSLKKLALVSVLPFALAMAGCATTTGGADEEEVATAQDAQNEAPRGPMGHHRFGPPNGGEMLVAALHGLDDLTPEQRKTIEGSLEKLGAPDHPAMKEMGKALADGVRKGKIDEAAVKAKADELAKMGDEKRAEAIKAIQTLHATLTPAQRATLVANIEERMEKHPMRGPMGEKGGPEGRGRHHGPMGEKGGPEREHGPMGEKGGPEGRGGHHGPMGMLLHGLELTDAQKEQIKSGLEASMPDKPNMEEMQKKHEEMRAKRKASLEAFREANFDAQKSLPDKPMMEKPFDHLVKALAVIVPVLDAGQREKLADRLEKGPEHREFGRHGKPGVDGTAPSR